MKLSVRKVVILVSALIAVGCDRFHDQFRDNTSSNTTYSTPENNAPMPASVHLGFGNPSNATQNPANENNFLVIGGGSAFSYNNSRGGVNWISWRTTRDDLGASLPRPDFWPDPRLPKWYNRIGYYDYSGSGYDRGHLVPSADRFANPQLNEETFMMSNIVPQTVALNQFPWNELEVYIRSLARKRMDIYQIAGCYGDAGRLKHKITVPTNCWKVAMILPRGRATDRVDTRARIIAVDMPNIEGIEKEKWQKYQTTIREIEQRTGLNIFSQHSQQLQDAIETRGACQSLIVPVHPVHLVLW